MDNKKWLAAFLEGQGIKGGKRTRMVAGIIGLIAISIVLPILQLAQTLGVQ